MKAVLKALHLASVHLDKLDNRAKAAEVVSRGRPTSTARPRSSCSGCSADYDYGDGRKEQDKFYMIFSDRDCNYPQPAFGKWWLSQFRRWGMVKGDARL